jgi:hypothetical protein
MPQVKQHNEKISKKCLLLDQYSIYFNKINLTFQISFRKKMFNYIDDLFND